MNELLDVNIHNNAQLLLSGIVKESNVLNAPLWIDGMNVEFQDGEVQKTKGYEILRTVIGKIIALAQANVDGKKRIYAQTQDAVWVLENMTLDNIGAYTAAQGQIVPWGKWIVVNSGLAVPKVWKNTSTIADLSGVTFTYAKILHRWGPYLFAMNTSNGGNWIEWCSDDNIEDWTPTASNSAGNYELRDLDSDIRSAAALGSNIAIYSGKTMQMCTYVGGTYVFSTLPAIDGIGAVSREAVVSAARKNFGISLDGLWATDGVNVSYVDNYDISKWIREHVNFDAAHTIKSVLLKDQVRFALPVDGAIEPNMVFGYNFANNAVSYYDDVPSAMMAKEVHDAPIFAYDSKIVKAMTGNNNGTEALTAFIQSKPLTCGSQELQKRIQLLRLIKGGTLKYKIGIQQSLDDAIEWIVDATAETVNNFADREGLYISLYFYSDAVDAAWTLSGFKLLGEVTGYAA